MHLPEELKERIETLAANYSLSDLIESSAQLTNRYRNGRSQEAFVLSEKDRIAYLLVRMPATYAAIDRVFLEIKRRIPKFSPKHFLDLGAGPGTGIWSSLEHFSSLEKRLAWEKDRGFIDIGKQLLSGFSQKIHWEQKDLERDFDFPYTDLALLSYSINEMKEEIWQKLLSSLWEKIQHSLVIIEPGTPIGYRRILKIREYLLTKGANIVAPCPHRGPCPLTGNDWCHFYSRIERSSLHRKIKDASLNYEDEKFSYLILTKENINSNYEGRILRNPKLNKGFVSFSICTNEGIKNKTITKKEKEFYKASKKLDWGDTI